MSSPAEFYKSLPPITKAYGTACLVTTVACSIGLLHPGQIAHIPYLAFLNFQGYQDGVTIVLIVAARCFRVLFTLLPLSGISTNVIIALTSLVQSLVMHVSLWSCVHTVHRMVKMVQALLHTLDLKAVLKGVATYHQLLFSWQVLYQFWDSPLNDIESLWNYAFIITSFWYRARYGVQLENGPFQRRTADFLWMMLFGALSLLVLSAIPYFWSPFLGISLVFMLLYVWSREFPNANINIYGLVSLKAFYLPWAMLCLDVIFGSPIVPDFLGIIAGHLYYFLTVLHPLAGGKSILKTPAIIIDRHKLVARWRIGTPPINVPQADRTTGAAFRGRSYRLGG
ncbi:hypothetical protein BUALT_Bualt09G0026000 [Buddleja alternifolia]|uniref:Derlin n=1 Tax=Buddleja alternifolia TaxID=168488 RepID=A0AAV6X611_9LAMI|nr:hypothetical protein BUALT_Bualt09G0026000 [Buddleja alternifolia]